jgi:hypothetical protein
MPLAIPMHAALMNGRFSSPTPSAVQCRDNWTKEHKVHPQPAHAAHPSPTFPCMLQSNPPWIHPSTTSSSTNSEDPIPTKDHNGHPFVFVTGELVLRIELQPYLHTNRSVPDGTAPLLNPNEVGSDIGRTSARKSGHTPAAALFLA